MSTKSGFEIEYYDANKHYELLAAASIAGLDISQNIPGATRFIAYGDTEFGFAPICIVDATYTQYVIEPHVIWFSWTTPAQKIRSFKWFINLLKQDREVLLNVALCDISFFEHFTKKGFLRKIGFINNLPKVGEIHMYQAVGE